MKCGDVYRIVYWWLSGIKEEKNKKILNSEEILVEIEKVVRKILRKKKKSVKYEVVDELIKCFLDYGMSNEERSLRNIEE
jgi:hypothetical protein